MHRSAAVLAVGDELTLGQTLDTNSAWIAERLLNRGVRVDEHATVDDNDERITHAMDRLASGHDLLICTGGLGPTADDLTRAALARMLGEPLIEDEQALAHIKEWFAGRGGMPPSNRVQAMRPVSARCLENPHGTAPGLAASTPRCNIFCLPGPPHEMQPMFGAFVEPALCPEPGRVTQTRIILTFGIGESRVAERLGELMDRDRPARGLPLVGTTASRGVVACRIRHTGPDSASVAGALDEVEQEINRRLGPAVFDRRDPAAGDPPDIADALPRAVVSLLRDRGERLAVAESCTAGLLGAEITRIPGSSEVFTGGWLTYSNEMKTSMLGVPGAVLQREGAVSGSCALAMARGAVERSGADHALSITGVAGPGGGTGKKPVGSVWIGQASTAGDNEARLFRFRGDRDAIRAWAMRTALGLLRLRLAGQDMRMLAEIERMPHPAPT